MRKIYSLLLYENIIHRHVFPSIVNKKLWQSANYLKNNTKIKKIDFPFKCKKLLRNAQKIFTVCWKYHNLFSISSFMQIQPYLMWDDFIMLMLGIYPTWFSQQFTCITISTEYLESIFNFKQSQGSMSEYLLIDLLNIE